MKLNKTDSCKDALGEKLLMDDLMDLSFYADIKDILDKAREKVYSTANSAMVLAYWNIGKILFKECGESERGAYGKGILKAISEKLTAEYGKGFTEANLRNMRQFYITFQNCNALRSELNWTQYRMLMRVPKEEAREFYLEECVKANWSSRQLERQINSFYYERLLASQNPENIKDDITTIEPSKKPEDIIHDPYVLEFIGLEDSTDFHEKELEHALIDKLQKFLLELGRGFSFVARQKHIDLDGEHFYIDLVFYNYVLKCFVLIDLKTGKLTHQDIGQMDSYVKIFDDMQKGDDDNPTIGIILCSEKNKAIARYSILNDSHQVFASKYQLTLPTEEELQRYIEEERGKIEEEDSLK